MTQVKLSIFAILIWLESICVLGQNQSANSIEATVIDSSSKKPVAFASVSLEGTYVGTSTNIEGQFSLTVDSSAIASNQVRVSCIGYESLTFSIEQAPSIIELKPTISQLKEVIIFGQNLNPEKIVKKAINKTRQNYYTKPFVYKTFYRHYCKDDSVYGRLIEAAVDIYKRKGYKAITSVPGQKDEVRVTQLRRSLDSTRVSEGHVPIALYSAMASDLAAYQTLTDDIPLGMLGFWLGVSSLKKDLKKYTFQLEELTRYENTDVFVVSFESSPNAGVELSTGIHLTRKTKGKLYISSLDYGIVRADITGISFDTLQTITTYQKINNRYFLKHIGKQGNSFNPINNFRHTYHIDLMVNEVQINNFEKFKGREPGKQELFSIPYDSSFWNNYTILKETPLEEKIITDLGGTQSLREQFAAYDTLKKKEYEREISGEGQLEKYLEASRNQQIIYIDFWASWCGPCIQEIPSEKVLADAYSGKIKFVMASIDTDETAWKKALAKHNLIRPDIIHFRIGPRADILKFLDVESIPRYVIIKKDGTFFDLNAKRPSDSALEEDFKKVIEVGAR